jgi:hypothetical protein
MLDWLSEPEALRKAIHQIVGEATRIDIAVAFWGAGPLQRAPLDARRLPLTRVIANVTSGGTNPAAIRELLGELGSDRVRQLNNLHAKVFLSNAHLIAGSANVSTNGLGQEGDEQRGWREVCVRSDDAAMMQTAQAWFDAQWNASSTITEADLVKAEEAWLRSRRSLPFSRHPSSDGQQGLLSFPLETLQGRRLFVAISSENNSAATEREIAKRQKTDPSIDGYEYWPDIPLDAVLLTFGMYKDAKHTENTKNVKFTISWDGFWETPANSAAHKASRIGAPTLVREARADRIPAVSKLEQKAWQQDISTLCQAFHDDPTLLPKDQAWDDWCIPIEDAWQHLNALAGRAAGESPLDTISDEDLRAAILAVAKRKSTFQSIDLIRRIVGRYLRDRGTAVARSPNGRFARRLSRDRKKLGIRLVRSNENVKDDDGGPSMSARWALDG